MEYSSRSSFVTWLVSYVSSCQRKIPWFAFGLARYQLSIPIINQNHIAFYNDQKVTIQGVVADEPDIRSDQIKYKIKATQLIGVAQKQKVTGNVLVNANLYPQFKFNDILEINCQLAAPQPIEDFSYDKFLAKENIYSVCYRGQLKSAGRYRGNYIKAAILKIKTKELFCLYQCFI